MRGIEPESDPAHYVTDRVYHYAKIDKARTRLQIEQLERQGFDVFINLCDADLVSDMTDIHVVEALEALECAFTGAGSDYVHISRELMKMSAHGAGGEDAAPYVPHCCRFDRVGARDTALSADHQATA